MSFPRQVNVQNAVAVAGDFASANINRYSVINGPGAFVAGPNGLTIGAFAWADPTYTFLNNTGAGPVTGFISREGLRADIIVPGPGWPDASMVMLAGSFATAYDSGDFWVMNNGSGPASVGQKCYADSSSGLCSFNVSGSPPVGASASAATLAQIQSAVTGAAIPTANTCTGYINGGTLTVTAMGAGSVMGPGATLTGTGIVPGTAVTAQLSGTPGGAGTYSVNIQQVAGSAGTPVAITLSGAGLTLTGANVSGTFAPGMTLSGTNVPAGEIILAYGTGTGGAGTYYVSTAPTTAVSAAQVTATNAMLLTVDATSSGTWKLNDTLSGSGVVAGQTISATSAQNPNLTGSGGPGTYLTNKQQTALAAQTISVASGVETKWYCALPGAVGELVAITSVPPG